MGQLCDMNRSSLKFIVYYLAASHFRGLGFKVYSTVHAYALVHYTPLKSSQLFFSVSLCNTDIGTGDDYLGLDHMGKRAINIPRMVSHLPAHRPDALHYIVILKIFCKITGLLHAIITGFS